MKRLNLLVFFLLVTMGILHGQTANKKDSLALVAFFNATGGPNWEDKSGWLTKNVSQWKGIKLDFFGEVEAISLRSNGLQGSVPPEIEELKNLTHLNFYFYL